MMNFELNSAIRKVRQLGVEYVTTKNPEVFAEYKKITKEFDTHEEELRNEFYYSNEVLEAEFKMDEIEESKGEFYAEYDENSNLYCVFHTNIKPDHAYSSYSNMEEAERDANERNEITDITISEGEKDSTIDKFMSAYNNNLKIALEDGYKNSEITQKAILIITARMFHDFKDKDLVNALIDLETFIK